MRKIQKGKEPEVHLESEKDEAYEGFKVTLQKPAKIKSGLDKHVVGQEHETLYRKCTGPSNNICQLGANETLITACSCMNEFGTASTMMQSLRQAAQDLICTTGDQLEYE